MKSDPKPKVAKTDPDNSRKSDTPSGLEGAKKAAKSVGYWIVMPGIFSKKNANPLFGIADPAKTIKRFYQNNIQFQSFKEVVSDNPEFEKVRPKAMKRLALLRNIALLWAICILAYQLIWGVNIFKIWWMDSICFWVFFLMSASMSFVWDFSRVVFEHRILGLTFFQYWDYRLARSKS